MAYAVVWLTVTVYVSPGVYVSTAAPNESTRLSAMLGLLVTPVCAPFSLQVKVVCTYTVNIGTEAGGTGGDDARC